MFYCKACPKCQGDLYLDQDQYGSFIECLQCGLLKDLKVNEELTNNLSRPLDGVVLPGQRPAAGLAA